MEILNNLGINFKSIIIQGIGFLILLFVLKKFLFGKISAMIKERSEGIKSTYTKIEYDRAEAERLKSEFQSKLSEAEAETARRIQEAINEGNRICEGIIKRAHEEAESLTAKAREAIEQERKKAVAEIRNQVVTLSMLASSRIIQQSISPQTAEKLVDDVIEEIGELSVR
ncbi:MAG TPA: F0F1 ATP synthase subunit B [Candidatus Wujingus californicus]|uniref:F0F1 ATP synthase subunit B n=1 Tax=Candidatus Wujingus californicus TaxID=3367618 RepID=UPI001DCCC7BA|nr:F0F1 ATP synthase subunit B [Planctomycetota bacterium]